MKLSRYYLVFGVVILIGLGMAAAGVFLLVQRETGTRAEATVINCTPTGYHGGEDCIGTWVTGGSLTDGGRVVTGSIDGATSSDLGKTITVTVDGDHAYTRSLTTPVVLLSIGLAAAVFMGVVVPLSLRRSASPAGAAYWKAAGLQHAFTGGATSGSEGLARTAVADDFRARAAAL